MYAVIETGGKQHKVEEGQTLLIDLISDDKKKITFDNVLLYSDDKNVEIGQPYLSNVKLLQRLLKKLKEPNYQFLDLEEESIVCANKGIELNLSLIHI